MSGPASPWADRFPNSLHCQHCTRNSKYQLQQLEEEEGQVRAVPGLVCLGFFLQNILSGTGDLQKTLCLIVCSRKMGLIPFTCLLQSWLWCLIHVSSLAGDCGMNDAI